MTNNMNSAVYNFTGHFTHRGEQLRIRPATEADQEVLRLWKNESKQFFHFKETITPQMQMDWFRSFSKQTDRQMYVCTNTQNEIVSCVGFKAHPPLLDCSPVLELFNLMSLNDHYMGSGVTNAFYTQLIKHFASQGVQAVCLEVLNTNQSAQVWYLRQGHTIYGEKPGCKLMIHRIGSKAL